MTDKLRAALEIIAAPPTDAPDAIGVKARNIARAALAASAPDEGPPKTYAKLRRPKSYAASGRATGESARPWYRAASAPDEGPHTCVHPWQRHTEAGCPECDCTFVPVQLREQDAAASAPDEGSLLTEDHSEIAVVPDAQRDVWLTEEQKRQPGIPDFSRFAASASDERPHTHFINATGPISNVHARSAAAPALDVERLREAIGNTLYRVETRADFNRGEQPTTADPMESWNETTVEAIAREYAALLGKQP